MNHVQLAAFSDELTHIMEKDAGKVRNFLRSLMPEAGATAQGVQRARQVASKATEMRNPGMKPRPSLRSTPSSIPVNLPGATQTAGRGPTPGQPMKMSNTPPPFITGGVGMARR